MLLWTLINQVDLGGIVPPMNVVDIPTHVVLLIDVSGSMVRLDPAGLAYQGAQMVSDLASVLNANVKVSVIFYGEKARFVVKDFGPHGLRAVLEDSLKNVKPEKYSDIREALKLARSLLQRVSLKREAYLIVLTDGQIKEGDIPPEEDIENYLFSLVEISREFKENKWTVYTFTTQEPVAELEVMSTTTGGQQVTISDLESLSKTFLDIIQASKSRFRLDVTHGSSIEFPMEKGVDEFSMVVAFDPKEKKVLRIYDPDGKEVEGERRSGRSFVIVKIKNPKPGIWKFEISKGATILLSMAIPRIIKPSAEAPSTEPIPVMLELTPITPEKPDWRNFSAKVYIEDKNGRQVVYKLYDDGKHGDGSPHDGVFGRTILKLAEGEYSFTVVVNHTPTNAEIRVKKKVKVVYIPVLALSFKGQFLIGTPMKIVLGISNRIKPIEEEKYTLTVKDPKGKHHSLKLKRNNFGYWEAIFPQTFYAGTYTVEARGMAVVKDSNRLRTFTDLKVRDTFSLCISFHKSKIPGFLFFGEMPGRTYTHELTLLNHCDTTFTVMINRTEASLSDSVKDRQIADALKPVSDSVPSFDIPPVSGKVPGKRIVEVKWHIPKDAVSGGYIISMKGFQRPTYNPIEIRYDIKVGSWRQVWLTFGGLGALIIGGAATWRFLRK